MEFNYEMTIRNKNCIPNNELWLHDPDVNVKLDKALDWAEKFPPQETDLDELKIQITSVVRINHD